MDVGDKNDVLGGIKCPKLGRIFNRYSPEGKVNIVTAGKCADLGLFLAWRKSCANNQLSKKTVMRRFTVQTAKYLVLIYLLLLICNSKLVFNFQLPDITTIF